ncbi:cytochrome P450 86B1-like [Trifolium medium]|uniref:Cytochrome P450 86B1-like n=1 Tax=Trifolium medium TaxID=97028 RepID=A0A392NY03_9FABA|nr:cytochrome P450 86B1-like [Trifolium medium]
MYHLIFKRKSFNKFFHQSVQKKVENCLLPFLDNVAEEGAQVDLQDAFNKFTFDNTCNVVFGFDPNCLPKKFNELRENSYQKSLRVLEEVTLNRHYIPTWLWKLQKWLNVGQEKKFKVATENIDRFLYQHTSTNSSSRSDEIGECYFDMLKAQTKEGYGRGEMSEKYLRDTALSLLIAGKWHN